MKWKQKAFSELSNDELYAIIKVRIDVFVVEQDCRYGELDDFDQLASHLVLENDGKIIAYARLLPTNTVYEQASIGRVLVIKSHRGKGYAKELMKKSIEIIMNQWQQTEIKIQGQEYLRRFYGAFGFREISDVYLDDGIPHVDMLLPQ